MIVSIDTEKVFNNIQQFMTKVISKPEIEKNFLQGIKGVYIKIQSKHRIRW